MTPYITRVLAQQIVNTVKDLCGQNVNFIDCSGTIFANTAESRIGMFHEIGQQAAGLDLELILASVNSRNKKAFLEKTLDKLSSEDLELLRIYFSCDMSLKKNCEETFLHKNTIQYRLNQIHKKSGYNPREFQDAVRLYLALKM